MPHMLAQEHLSIIDAIRYGTARTEATLAAAISAIGATPTTLVLTMSGDGIWTIGANLTTPANITVLIPDGVRVNIAASQTWTCHGIILAYDPNFKFGPGTLTETLASARGLVATSLAAQAGAISGAGIPFSISLRADPTHVMLFPVEGNVAISFCLGPGGDQAWQTGVNTVGYYYVSRPTAGFGGSPVFTMNDVGVGIGLAAPVVAEHLLHLGTDDAFKATASWSVPCDERLKAVDRPYADGLATVQALPTPVVYAWNGKAQTPNDGKEYIGMLAQEVEPVAPYLLSTYQGKLEPEDPAPTDIYSMNSSPLVFMLINAVKELAARVEALEGPALRRAGQAPAPSEDDEAPRPVPRKRGKS